MDNAIVKTTIMKNMTHKLLTVMLLSVISSTALLEPVASSQTMWRL